MLKALINLYMTTEDDPLEWFTSCLIPLSSYRWLHKEFESMPGAGYLGIRVLRGKISMKDQESKVYGYVHAILKYSRMTPVALIANYLAQPRHPALYLPWLKGEVETFMTVMRRLATFADEAPYLGINCTAMDRDFIAPRTFSKLYGVAIMVGQSCDGTLDNYQGGPRLTEAESKAVEYIIGNQHSVSTAGSLEKYL